MTPIVLEDTEEEIANIKRMRGGGPASGSASIRLSDFASVTSRGGGHRKEPSSLKLSDFASDSSCKASLKTSKKKAHSSSSREAKQSVDKASSSSAVQRGGPSSGSPGAMCLRDGAGAD